MKPKKNIFVIIGSAATNSANEQLINYISVITEAHLNLNVFKELKTLPHFDPQLSTANPPEAVIDFRKNIEQADGIIICTPEYVFSIPSGLKNAIEWCVATTVFSDKPAGLITASANGMKGHEELKLVMKTLMAKFTEETTLLIQGIKGRITETGDITDESTKKNIESFIDAFIRLVNN